MTRKQFNQWCLPIDLHHCAYIPMQLADSKYFQNAMFTGGYCRADLPVAKDQFRARSLPANDNCVLAESDKDSRRSKSTRKATWPTVILLLCVSVMLFLTNAFG
jgi:hypothetical protein